MRLKLISWRFVVLRYGAALVAVGVGLGCHLGLEALIGQDMPPYTTFYPFVMLAALLAGFGPGLLATVAAGLAVDYWLLRPMGFTIDNPVEAIHLGLFTAINVFMCAVAEWLRRARLKAAAFDREQVLRESRRQNEFLANLIQHASQPFAVGYPDGRLGLLNHAFEELTGYTAEELRSTDWSTTLTPPEWREVERQTLDALRRTRQPVRYEKEYVRKDGSRVPVELLVHLGLGPEGEPEYYHAFVTDISERRRAEEAEQWLNADPDDEHVQ